MAQIYTIRLTRCTYFCLAFRAKASALLFTQAWIDEFRWCDLIHFQSMTSPTVNESTDALILAPTVFFVPVLSMPIAFMLSLRT
jgi:hypothetical protein